MITKTNCLFFALRLYIRRRRKGKKGYILARISKYYPGPHFMYVRIRPNDRCQIVGYVPKYPKKRLLPPPVFDGRVEWGDRAT